MQLKMIPIKFYWNILSTQRRVTHVNKVSLTFLRDSFSDQYSRRPYFSASLASLASTTFQIDLFKSLQSLPILVCHSERALISNNSRESSQWQFQPIDVALNGTEHNGVAGKNISHTLRLFLRMNKRKCGGGSVPAAILSTQ